MKKSSRTKIFLFIAIGCLFLTSCGQAEYTMEVLSMDYGITEYAGVLLDENGVTLDITAKSDYVVVDEYCGKLVLSSYRKPINAHVAMGGYGYFTGLDLGEFDGWLRYSEYHSDVSGEEDILIARESCHGFEEIADGCFVTCTSSAVDYQSYLYLLQYTPENESGYWKWERYATIEDWFIADFACDSEENAYVITSSNLLKIDREGNVEIVISGAWWRSLGPTSMVFLDDVLYIGCDRGFLQYKPDGRLYWFSVE